MSRTDVASSRSLPQVSLPDSPYVAYAYSYPHKTAYRPLTPPRMLRDVWRDEPKDSLFLYMHVPFCEMRCGFCNLFTSANARGETMAAYISAVERQAEATADAVGPHQVSRMAIGGGTPTFLQPAQLEGLLQISHRYHGVAPGSIPISVETSPRTASLDRLGLLKDFGVSRISIGVQSFLESEVTASARAQKNEWVENALSNIRSLQFPLLNIDLIYGLPGQSVESWLQSLRAAMRWTPEELYLYPLYVRPLTGLDRRGCAAHDQLRLDCYRAGRELLESEGYEQVSMRMFRRANSPATDDPVYCCQEDGMIGLGCGARSYTRLLHYSTDFAVTSTAVNEIIADFTGKTYEAFSIADYGCEVTDSEQRRRWVIKSLFRTSGFDRGSYRSSFGQDVLDDMPLLCEFAADGYLEIDDQWIRPSASGLERSDALAPMLFSPQVRASMAAFDLR